MIDEVQATLAARLRARFARASTDHWPWLEASVGHDSSRVAQAMIVAGARLGDEETVAIGARSLSWLLARQRAAAGCFVPLGAGTGDDGGPPLDQLPLEAGAAVSACLAALQVTGDARWADEASSVFGWFLGRNQVRRPLYDPRSGGCCDALHADRASHNQGAEGTLSYLLAATELRAWARIDPGS